MIKVAFVVQRYGLEVNGGAEVHCRWIAEHMSKYWDIEILTTCAIDYDTWKDEYKPGKDVINGISIRRFSVDGERDKKFNQFSDIVLNNKNSRNIELEWMRLQGPYSTTLFNYLEEKKEYYDYFIFFTYLYATTFFGLPIVKNKALMVPTAHDEPAIYLKIFDELFDQPVRIIFNSQQEMNFLHRRFKNLPEGDIIGVGINCPDHFDGNRFCRKYNIKNDFLLYIGRIDTGKGCKELFDFFLKFKKENKIRTKLVLLGKPQMGIPKSSEIIHLGFVSEQDKFDALDASRFLIMPSFYESLSMVTLEAFFTKTPVLANGRCLVLKDLCRKSNGGLYYTNYAEFSECLNFMLENNGISRKLGRQGAVFAEMNYNWDTIENKFLKLINQLNTQ